MSRHPLTVRRALGVVAVLPLSLLISMFLPSGPATAHPLDACLQAAYLTPAPNSIGIDLDISPGVLVAAAALAELDIDRDRQIDDAEARAYAERVVGRLRLNADDVPLRVVLTGVDMPPYLTIQAGYGVIRLHARADGAPAADGTHEILFRNDHVPAGATYQVNAVSSAASPAVLLGTQQRDAAQQQSRIVYRIDAVAGAQPAATAEVGAPAGSSRLAGFLESRTLSAAAVLFAIGFAALLGALHALTPGHAKTLMAAYLVGSGGTTRNAVALGAVVTFTHTASVIVIGLVALFASRFLVPGVLVPAMEIVAGVLVLMIGVQLVRRRWPVAASMPVGAGHDHSHHAADHHTHTLPAGGVTPRSLVAMGVSGGLVPCPEALGVMVLAVGVNRTVLGLGLILSFSLGLAAVLMGLGIVLVRSRHLLGRFTRPGTRWTSALPLVSALVVSVLGAGLLLKGLNNGIPMLS